MCVAVYEILTALEPALPEEEIQKRVFDAISISNVKKRGLFMSLRRRHLDKAGRLLFHNTVVLCNVRREM